MSIRILHTADIHVGMKFSGRNYPEAIRQQLIQERIDILARLVQRANQHSCNFIVIAGDLFDSIQATKTDIEGVIAALAVTSCEVIIIPGNHDYFVKGKDTLWGKFMERSQRYPIRVLHQKEPYTTQAHNQTVTFYPAPCPSKHSDTNELGWIDASLIEQDHINIGIAHGNVDGLGPQGDKYFNMTPDELKATQVPLWLLGHIHVPYPTPAPEWSHLWYAGTPTPDGFDCRHGGTCWLLDIDMSTKKIKSELLETGAFRFKEIEAQLDSRQDFTKLKKQLEVLTSSNTLLKIKLNGKLSADDLSEVGKQLSDITKSFVYSYLENNLSLRIDSQYIQKTFAANTLPYLLLNELSDDELALQLAYSILEESKS